MDRVPTILKHQQAADGGNKLLWRLADGCMVESTYVLLPEQGSTCISSQVGCNLGCPFCATGQQFVVRNLTSEEIIAQVEGIEGQVRAAGGTWPLEQVDLAGMGEPLLNFNAVVQAAAHLRTRGLARVISLSTSGVVQRMCDLAEMADPPINKLCLSLHATTNEIRNVLVPLNRRYSIVQVLAAGRIFAKKTATKVVITYMLLADLNDSDGDLYRLLDLLDPDLFIVQLNEWNLIRDASYPFIPSPRLDFFQRTLERQGLEAYIQPSRGCEIEGGYGQLRPRMNKKIESAKQQAADPLLVRSCINRSDI